MSSFQITNPNVRLQTLKPGDSADATYTVANVSGSPRRAVFRVQTKDVTGVFKESASGYALKGGQNVSEFAPGATQQVAIVVAPPASAVAGPNVFRLFVGAAGQEDADFDVGPEVTYDIAKVEKKAFPWWIVAVAVALLVVVGGTLAFLHGRTPAPVPTPKPTFHCIPSERFRCIPYPFPIIRTFPTP